jgi:Zn ribbon nucleic-acid-binding protein
MKFNNAAYINIECYKPLMQNIKPKRHNNMKTFKFIGIKDYGSTVCPHCGSEGRYIYTWEEDGVSHAAMAGCYKLLTKKIEKSDENRYFELLAEKQAKNKPLNGWDKRIIGLLKAQESGKASESWVQQKIHETLSERNIYLNARRY